MHPLHTIILGVSRNPFRYANLAAEALKSKGIPFVAVGRNSFRIQDFEVTDNLTGISMTHTFTIYLRPELQPLYYSEILRIRPERIIFNPGTYNPELNRLAKTSGIQTLEACTLVLLSSGQY